MKTLKHILSIFICLTMTISVLPALPAFAETYSGTCGDNLTWTLDTDTGVLTISGTGDMLDYAYPSAPWYSYRASITSIIIGDNVTSIGNAAFRYCEALTSVIIPNSVTSIGSSAFYDCVSLTSITIPDNVTSIGNGAFYFCGNLNITVDSNNLYYSSVDGVLFNKNQTEIISYAKDKICPNYIIPMGVTTIGDYAFYYCTALANVSIPNSVTTIGNSAFYCCYDLMNITIPNSVTTIGSCAFDLCYSLTHMTIPNSVTTIGSSAFYDCFNLTSVTIPDSVTTIENNAFYHCALTNVTIPNSVTSIGMGCFSNCTSLTSITIPNSVTTIGSSAFSYCTALTNIAIPDSVLTIDDYTFSDCFSLTSVIISDSITSIGNAAFFRCTSLTDVYYTGSEDEWNAINIDSGNTYLTSATIHYNCVAIPTEKLLPAIGEYENAAEADVIVTEDGSVSVNLTISDKNILSAENVTAYAVSYSGSTAESVTELSKTITSDGASFSGTVSGSYKIFIWDENMRPITKVVE